MTNELKTQFLTRAVEPTKAHGSVVWESKDLVNEFPLTPEEMDYLLDEFQERGFVHKQKGGQDLSGFLFLFTATPAAETFLKLGGYQEEALAVKKREQLELDVADAAIRSADAAEASAISSEKSAKEAKLSRIIAIIAAVIAAVAIVVECTNT